MLRTRSNFLIGAAALGGLALSINPAAAQSVQDQKLLVQATIGDLCTVTSASLDFGASIDLDTNNDTSGTIEIDCVGQTDVSVELDNGHVSFGPRAMTNGQSSILYQLFKDAARSQAWSAGDGVTQTINSTGSVPVFGRIPVQANGHTAGVYTDEVTITLNF